MVVTTLEQQRSRDEEDVVSAVLTDDCLLDECTTTTTSSSSDSETTTSDDSDNDTDTAQCLFDRLPMELLEMVLMRSFVSMFAGVYRKTLDAGEVAYAALGGVSWDWRQTMLGWPQSRTRSWFKHQLKQQLHTACRPYRRRAELLAGLPTQGKECAVAHLNDYIYVSWRFCDTIKIFRDSPPYDWQKDVVIPGIDPRCITSCRINQTVYVLDWRDYNIWKLRKDGTVALFQNPERAPCQKSLSCTGGRLLVVGENCLRVYQADDALLCTVELPSAMSPQHAVETQHGTYIVSHTANEQPAGESSRDGEHSGEIPVQTVPHTGCISEVNGQGEIVRSFSGIEDPVTGKTLEWPYHVALDPEGRIFVADFGNKRVLMLNADLELVRIVVGTGSGGSSGKEDMMLEKPWRLCYNRRAGQLMVCEWLSGVKVFNLR